MQILRLGYICLVPVEVERNSSFAVKISIQRDGNMDALKRILRIKRMCEIAVSKPEKIQSFYNELLIYLLSFQPEPLRSHILILLKLKG